MQRRADTLVTNELLQDVCALRDRVVAEVSRIVVGLDHVADQLLIAMVAWRESSRKTTLADLY